MYDMNLTRWYLCLDDPQKRLIDTTQYFIKKTNEIGEQENLDYSFLIFGVAKAYEGFLKKFLLELNLISKEVYFSRRFRIGRALNPDVYPDQRDNWWLYDDVVRKCGNDIARELWQAWLECRNQVFHYFPKHDKTLSFKAAQAKVEQLAKAMQRACDCVHMQFKKK